MPIARNPAQHNYHWIPREAETEFQNLLKDGKAYVLPLVGVGGAGKTSLLRRFFSHCERNEIPAIYIDLPRLIVSGALDMWLRVETVHTKAFDEHRKKLNTSYETLSAMLQPYGDNASGAAELLQKGVGKDENYGLAVGAIRDAGKLVYEFWQRRENQQQQELLQKPEETLLRALAKDFQKRGVILIDTLEQAGKQNLSTRLRFRDDGELETPAAEHPRTANLIEYCAGMAHFLFDKPVIMVLAGRPPAIRELGALPLDYFAPTVDVPAFTADEIRTYLESSLPRQIAPPQDSDISKLQQLTLGNPFLLERVVRLLADWQPTWEWQVEQWQPLLNSFQQDERHGLLLYVTQRLLTHVLPDDRAFWRLALPRQYIHRDMAELLFPKDEFGEQSGLQRLKTYEEKGTIYREQDPDRYFLHDETRAAFTAWAKREKVWLDKAALEIHARLVTWFDQQSGWPAEYPDPKAKTPQNDNALLLEGAYHAFMADSSFEQREKNQDKEEFWRMLAGSPYRSNAWKRQRIDLLSTEESRETSELLEADHKRCISNFNDGTSYHLIQKATDGHLPADWQENETTLRELLKIMPDDAELWESLAWIESLSMEEREQYFEKALTLDSNNANRLNSFAVFMQVMQKNYDRTENLYQQAMTANHKSPHHINNFARFMHKIRKDYDRAEDLYQQAMNADPKSAYHISNFAHFIENIRNDYDRAEDLYQQAMNADPKSAYHISNFARFMEKIRKNFNRAETLYKQAFDAEPKNINNIRLFANFMRNVRKDYKHANKLYFQAIRDGLQDHGILCDYSRFLHNSYKKYNQAEKFYKEALRTEPECVITLTNFANFLWQIRKDFPRAEKFYEQAINIEPNNIINLRNFALFIETIRKDFDRAENLYQRAFEIDPNNTETIIKFLVFLENQGKNNIYLEKLYEKMPGIIKIPNLNENINNNLKLDLKLLTNNNGSMFKIMLKTLQSNPELEKTMNQYSKINNEILEKIINDTPDQTMIDLYEIALKINSNNIKELAQFLLLKGKKFQGKTLIDQAFATNPESAALKLELWFYRLAHFPQDYPQAQVEIMALLETGARSEGWDFSGNIAQAEKDGHPNIALLRTLADTITQQTSEPQASIL